LIWITVKAREAIVGYEGVENAKNTEKKDEKN
jgi:hypothetical protein